MSQGHFTLSLPSKRSRSSEPKKRLQATGHMGPKSNIPVSRISVRIQTKEITL
jgi:hypothetical protein